MADLALVIPALGHCTVTPEIWIHLNTEHFCVLFLKGHMTKMTIKTSDISTLV